MPRLVPREPTLGMTVAMTATFFFYVNIAMSKIVIEGRESKARLNFGSIQGKYTILLESITIPYVWDNLPAFVMDFVDHGGVYHPINFSSGNWMLTEFLNLLITNMMVLDPGVIYSYAVNQINNIFTISANVPGFWSINSSNYWVNQRLGINATDDPVGQTFTSRQYFLQTRGLLLSSNFQSNDILGTSADNLAGYNSFLSSGDLTRKNNFFAFIPVQGERGQLMTSYFGELSTNIQTNIRSGYLEFTLTDEFNLPLSLTTSWNIVLFLRSEAIA